MTIGCHDPDCRADADQLAYDSMIGLNVAFCDDCAPAWRDVDHIEFQEAIA